jgi:transposase
VQLGQMQRAVGLFDVPEHPAGADRGELLIIPEQPDTGTASDGVLDRRSIALVPPADNIEEPEALRRTDGSSVYTVAAADLYTSQRILDAEQRLVLTAGRRDGPVVHESAVDLALLEMAANKTALDAGQAALVRQVCTSGARLQLMGDRRREIVRLELMLEDASIKLSSVASSLKTVSARAMLTAMIEGETNPLTLANLAKGKMRRKIPDLAQALTGTFDAHHARLARSMLRRLELVESALAELDAVIAAACRPWQHQIDLLETIPGVGPKVAQVIVAETGADMSRFPTAAHLAAWAGLAPAMHESAGKQSPAGKRHGNKWLTAMLVEAAGSVGRMHGKNYLAGQHARLLKRRGMGRAQVAVAHSMLVSAYWMLRRDEPYHDLGADWHRRRSVEAHTRRLVAQLEHLGHTVIIDPAA